MLKMTVEKRTTKIYEIVYRLTRKLFKNILLLLLVNEPYLTSIWACQLIMRIKYYSTNKITIFRQNYVKTEETFIGNLLNGPQNTKLYKEGESSDF